MWNKTEVKHCRRCLGEITVILLQFYFSCISCCAIRLKQIVSAFQSCIRGFNTLKNTAADTCEKPEIKHCRRCSREITVILFQFHFSFISCCASRLILIDLWCNDIPLFLTVVQTPCLYCTLLLCFYIYVCFCPVAETIYTVAQKPV